MLQSHQLISNKSATPLLVHESDRELKKKSTLRLSHNIRSDSMQEPTPASYTNSIYANNQMKQKKHKNKKIAYIGVCVACRGWHV